MMINIVEKLAEKVIYHISHQVLIQIFISFTLRMDTLFHTNIGIIQSSTRLCFNIVTTSKRRPVLTGILTMLRDTLVLLDIKKLIS